jgi:hypothetical protein
VLGDEHDPVERVEVVAIGRAVAIDSVLLWQLVQ